MENIPEKEKLRTVLFTLGGQQDLSAGHLSVFSTDERNVGEKLLKGRVMMLGYVIEQLLEKVGTLRVRHVTLPKDKVALKKKHVITLE